MLLLLLLVSYFIILSSFTSENVTIPALLSNVGYCHFVAPGGDFTNVCTCCI